MGEASGCWGVKAGWLGVRSEGKRVFVLDQDFPLSSCCVCGPLFCTLSGLHLTLSEGCGVKGGRLEMWGEGEGRLC